MSLSVTGSIPFWGKGWVEDAAGDQPEQPQQHRQIGSQPLADEPQKRDNESDEGDGRF